MLNTLDHVIVGVADLDAAAEQTAALLGRPASWRGTHPEYGTANVLFRVANSYLELISQAGEGPIGELLGKRLAEQGDGLVGMAFGTDDADAAAAFLRGRGLPVLDPQPGHGRDLESGAERRWRNVLVAPEASRGGWLFAIEHETAADALALKEPACERAAAVAALDHVVVMSPDPDGARALYGDGLGLRLALDRSFEERGVRLLFFRVGGATIEIGGRLGAEPDRESPDRLWGIAWQVPDADAAHARLAAAGFDLDAVRDGFKPGTRVFTVRGEPCGVATLVIEPVGGLPK